MSGDPKSNDRLRQIAILVSCVDPATARQLLLHLPTAKAKQVHRIAAQLGTVSEAEKRRILADFQRTAAIAPQATAPEAPATPSLTANGPAAVIPPAAPPEPDPNRPPWTQLSVEGLLQFLRGERPAIIAVVVSQLDPSTAVSVLQELPGAVNAEVLTRMASLGDVDAEANTAIDEYLAERLSEYEKTARSEGENRRRMDALLSAAPTALREQWQNVLAEQSDLPYEAVPAQPEVPLAASATPDVATQQPLAAAPTLSDLYGDSIVTTAQPNLFPNPAAQLADSAQDTVDFSDTSDAQEDAATILPFPSPTDQAQQNAPEHQDQSSSDTSANLAANDHSLIQLEFEQLLQLPPSILAQVLSRPDADTVLMALAGASPQFIDDFNNMLRPEDAAELQSKLQNFGPVQLRDIDESQRRIVEIANSLSTTSKNSTQPVAPAYSRRAA